MNCLKLNETIPIECTAPIGFLGSIKKKEQPKIKPLHVFACFGLNVGTEVLIILFSPFIYFPINSFIAMTSNFMFLF